MASITWDDAILDPATRWRWLVRLTAQGLDARYAEDECYIGGYQWRKGLEMSDPPSLEADVYEGRASLSPFTITLFPELSDPSADPAGQALVELDVVMGYGGGEISIEMWRWPDGVDFIESSVLVRGTADSPKMNADGTIEITCQSFIDAYNVQLPLATCEERLWPNAAEDDYGAGYPILLGDYFRSECPCISTNGVDDFRHVIGQYFGSHSMSSATMYVDDVETAPASKTTATDADGNTIYYAQFTGTVTDGTRVTASGTGLVDDAEGTYTGNVSYSIGHPASQIHFLMAVVCGVPEELIDAGSYGTVRGLLSGWKFSTSIRAGESTQFINLSEDICKWMRAVNVPERGKMRLRLCQFDNAPIMTIDETNILEPIEISWGDKSQVVTRHLLYYAYGIHVTTGELRYLNSIYYGPSESTALALAEYRYGSRYSKRQEYEARNIYDYGTALSSITRYAELREKMRRIVKVRCDASTHGLNIFDTVSLDISNIPWWMALDTAPKNMVLIAIEYGLHDNLLTLMEC